MNDLLFLSVLFEYYGSLLTDRQYEICDMYLNQNLSLGEIASLLGISRQGVRDGLIKSENLLKNYEDKLKIQEKNASLSIMIEKIQQLSSELDKKEIAEKIVDITNEINDLL